MSGFPAWVPFVATIGFVALSVAFIWGCIRVCLQLRKHHFGEAIEQAIFWLSHLYSIGVTLKLAGIGPEFGRYHLADYGFPATIVVLVAATFVAPRLKYDDRSTFPALMASEQAYAKNRLKLVPVALGLSIAYEIFAGYVNHTSSVPVPYIGDFDWIDIIMYAAGAATLGALLIWKLRLYRNYFESLRVLNEVKEKHRVAQQVAKATRGSTSARKRRKKRKRGVR